MIRRALAVAVLATVGLVGFAAQPAEARAPYACRQAISEAREVMSISARFAEAVSAHLGEVGDAADVASHSTSLTGVTTFLRTMTASVQTLGSTATSLTAELKPHGVAFNSAAARCK